MKNNEIQKELEDEYLEHQNYLLSLNKRRITPANIVLAAAAVLFLFYARRRFISG
jgi:hypothetical protein